MVAIKLDLFLLLNTFYVSDCVRRIQGGATVQRDKTYMVYLVQASKQEGKYDEWMCGGVLVSPVYILTSAACVEDVKYLYAIAGYRKYVQNQEIETDKCTKEKKKKVIYTGVPVNYEISFEKLEKWSYIDIALAQVESAYDLKDNTFEKLCSYIPTVIPVCYEERFQEPGTNAIVLGWGHKNIWRLPEDTKNYNQKILNYASVKIMEKEPCKKAYLEYTGMDEVIDQFMVCTFGKGLLDDKGKIVYGPENQPPKLRGCSQTELLSMHDILDDDEKTLVVDMTRRGGCLRSNQISNDSLTKIENITLFNMTRRERGSYGICQKALSGQVFILSQPYENKPFLRLQNDHGGPLVTWVGKSEVVIGVASVFKVDAFSRNCEGPYLFTSTHCSGAFLNCMLSDTNVTSRTSFCDSPPTLRGYDIVERHISWRLHPTGTAANITLASLGSNTTTGKSKKHEPYGKIDKFWNRFRNQGLAKKETVIKRNKPKKFS